MATMRTTVKYRSDFLKVIWWNAKTNAYSPSFQMETLGNGHCDSIKDKKMKRSLQKIQGGTKIFHCIRSIMLGTGNAFNNMTLTGHLTRTIHIAILVLIQACQTKSMIHSTSACRNCQSVIIKSQDIQLDVTTSDLN